MTDFTVAIHCGSKGLNYVSSWQTSLNQNWHFLTLKASPTTPLQEKGFLACTWNEIFLNMLQKNLQLSDPNMFGLKHTLSGQSLKFTLNILIYWKAEGSFSFSSRTSHYSHWIEVTKVQNTASVSITFAKISEVLQNKV
jgi:hypothetical protein